MQTLVPIGTFEDQARKLLGNAGFDDLLEFWRIGRRLVALFKVPAVFAKYGLPGQAVARAAVLE